MLVSVAIPVLNGGPLLDEVLAAVAGQQLGPGLEFELLVCDSGSVDGSAERCAGAGARVLSIAPAEFSHGGTRNRLMEAARGELVAFLTQDAVPASPTWLAALTGGFALADNVALTYGPYLARADASPMVARELSSWFGSLAPDGRPRIDVLSDAERGSVPGVGALSARDLYGPRPFFTDANGAVRKSAWEQVRFRPIAYAEDHALALDMLFAGYAKAYVPAAAVVHSHDYRPRKWLARSFDEARAVAEIYGYVEPASPSALVRRTGALVRADMRDGGAGVLGASVMHHGSRAAGAVLGGRAERLPRAVSQALSLERRAS
jgi:glycosyltransferase involved in cell wall biosynthesis